MTPAAKKSDGDTAAAAGETPETGAAKPDSYYAVLTGDTCDSVAKKLGHDGEGQALFDAAHPGGISNGENIARHLNLIAGADGEKTDDNGRLIPVLKPEDVNPGTKLVEGQSLLLPTGW